MTSVSGWRIGGFIPQYLPRCSQRKSSDRDCKIVCGYNSETQNCIFDAQIYSFLFRHFEKSFRKSRKSPENSAFYVVSCKTVISDKWWRYYLSGKIGSFIKSTFCCFDLKPGADDIITSRPQNEALKPQMLRNGRQRKSLGAHFSPLSEIQSQRIP